MQRPRFRRWGSLVTVSGECSLNHLPLPAPVSGPAWWLTLISLGPHLDCADSSLRTPDSRSATAFPQALLSI